MIPHIDITTLEQAFDLYFRGTSDPDASQEERDAARKDFYAGAASVTTLLAQAITNPKSKGFGEVYNDIQKEILNHVVTNMVGKPEEGKIEIHYSS